jgi:hypothetical protein
MAIDAGQLAALARTPAGRRKIREMQRATENRIAGPAKAVAAAKGFKGPPKRTYKTLGRKNPAAKHTASLPVGRKFKRDRIGRFA